MANRWDRDALAKDVRADVQRAERWALVHDVCKTVQASNPAFSCDLAAGMWRISRGLDGAVCALLDAVNMPRVTIEDARPWVVAELVLQYDRCAAEVSR